MAFSSAKGFLLQECANLQDVLEETLRFKYGLEGSKDFFEECQARLTFIRGELESADEKDSERLQDASVLLCGLSDLLSRIERSSIGEYSWPFVEELKRIGVATCSEATAADPNAIPQFHVWSSGGLDGYAIEREMTRPSGSRKRIHTIILPKTLKHCVLLHSILGHEIGHAMFRCSKHQRNLDDILRRLTAGTAFENPASTANWLYSTNAPAEIKKQLAAPQFLFHGIGASNFFRHVASWDAWLEEILCDFVGLITFGPSFVAAECNLLYSMDQSGAGIGARHPPVGCRANYLAAAIQHRGFESSRPPGLATQKKFDEFWKSLRQRTQADNWFNVFPEPQLKTAVNEFTALFGKLVPALYDIPTPRKLELLIEQASNHVPPVGHEVGSLQTICWEHVDFRDILYAGWVVSANDSSIPFAQLSRLCEHAIMQQRAINIELGRPA